MNFSKNKFKVLFRKKEDGSENKEGNRKRKDGRGNKWKMGMNKRKSLFPLGSTQTVLPFCVYLLAIRLSLIYVNLLNL